MKSKGSLTIDEVLAQIAAGLQLSSQTERDLLDEIRGHLEDARDAAVKRGQDPDQALRLAAEKFGVEISAKALQEEHGPWESADAIVACILPVAGTLILRWLAFVPDGSAAGWGQLLLQPIFWLTAVLVLATSYLYFKRWRLALTIWGFFWVLSVVFIGFGIENQQAVPFGG